MAREFGRYSPNVSMAINWEETFQLFEDEAETTPLNITGFDVRAQIRTTKNPVLVSDVAPNPLLELTTAGYYASPPGWPVVEAFDVVDEANGIITLNALKASIRQYVSPTNAKKVLFWQVLLVNKDTGEDAPVVAGRPKFNPAITV